MNTQMFEQISKQMQTKNDIYRNRRTRSIEQNQIPKNIIISYFLENTSVKQTPISLMCVRPLPWRHRPRFGYSVKMLHCYTRSSTPSILHFGPLCNSKTHQNTTSNQNLSIFVFKSKLPCDFFCNQALFWQFFVFHPNGTHVVESQLWAVSRSNFNAFQKGFWTPFCNKTAIQRLLGWFHDFF